MKTISKKIFGSGLAAMALGMAGNASAAITYRFNATSSFGGPYGSFELITANFLAGVNTFALASLTSCSVTFSSGSADCGDQLFDTTFYDLPPFYETIAFGTTDLSASFYYFQAGAFGTLENHSSQIFGSGQFATLTVNDPNVVAGVPEPASWALMIAGFGLVGAGMRRRTANLRHV